MRRRALIWSLTLLVLGAIGAGGYIFYQRSERAAAPVWRTAPIARGTLTASVSATGTLNAEVSVPVGSQVSGQVREVLADFNSEVRKGQLIARIDPETFEYRVRQSQADVDAARAQVLTAQANISAARAAVSRVNVNLAEARRDLERKQLLVERQFISGAELDKARAVLDAATEESRSARAQVEVAQAQAGSAAAVVAQREAQLLQARADLERTAIRAPVDGIVIRRTIDAGQTVAASLQAPELFVIARNLRDMQVDTSIDEAEIGRIRPGQRASFTVDSYPGRSFSGVVKQVRKAALTVQNVVTYTVVVATPNADLALIPGMTANVRIVTETRENVLKAPNAALRFRPPDWQEPVAGGAAGAAPGGATGAAPGPAADRASGASANPLGQFRERLERELSFTDDQRTQVVAIFAAAREKFAALGTASEADRARLSERYRAELRERIGDLLNPGQKQQYAVILAEIAGRPSSRGRIFLAEGSGPPRAVSVRTGLTDGAFTEIAGEGVKDGDTVIIGLQGSAAGSRTPAPAAGPRLPF